MTKIQIQSPLPLAEHETISEETAITLFGQIFKMKVVGKEVCDGKVVAVDWRSEHDVMMTLEVDLPKAIVEVLMPPQMKGFSIGYQEEPRNLPPQV